MMIKRTKRRTNLKNKQRQGQFLARQKLSQQVQQVRQQKKITFAQLESLISLSRQAKNSLAAQKWKKIYQKKEQNWARSLLKGQEKLLAKRKSLVKSAPLYSQLRKQVRQEEKFLFLRELNPRLNWDQSQNSKVSFAQSQQINKRTNLALRELAQIRAGRIKDYQEKTGWSLRKQRARIRKVRGKIDETAYRQKLQERQQFTEKLGNYQGKLAREQFWSKKFRASPISLAQAELIKLRIQPDYQPSRDIDAEIFTFRCREQVPPTIFNQPWLSYRHKKTAQFSSIFSGSPRLKKEVATREPLIDDKLKEYQYKLNFYQLFGRPPRTEKEIRKFASIDWAKEKDAYWALYGSRSLTPSIAKDKKKRIEQALHNFRQQKEPMTSQEIAEKLWAINNPDRHSLIVHPLDDKLWAQTQKNILVWGREQYYWTLKGNKEGHHLPLFSSRSEQAKFFQAPQKSSEVWIWKNYDQQYLEKNKEKLSIIKKRLSSRWQGEIDRIKSAYPSWNIKSYGQGLSANLVLTACSPKCNCSTNSYCDPTGSEPACYIGYEFMADNHWGYNQHPPLAPGQCSYLNTSHFGREVYGKPNRWIQCGNQQPVVGDSWHHDFDAWHKNQRGWGCHFSFPPEERKKQKSRSTIVEMEW